MTDEYSVKITTQAQEQLREITQYVMCKLQNPIAATHLLDTMESSIASLSLAPKRIALTEEKFWNKNAVHKMPVKNFFVYFWINESTKIVHVTAVIYGRRDQLKQLSKMDME